MTKPNYLTAAATIFLCLGTVSAHVIKTPAPSADVQDLHAIIPEDVLSIRELDELKISTDGKRIAFVVTEPNDLKKPREPRPSNLWLVPSDGSAAPRSVIPGLNNVSSPRWSPDGKTLAFLSDRGEAKTRVLVEKASAILGFPYIPFLRPMILHGCPCGKVGRRRINIKSPFRNERAFCFSLLRK
jgi:WD40-like Beta Propeller Repeat